MAMERLFRQLLSLQSQRSEIWAPDRADRKRLQGHTNQQYNATALSCPRKKHGKIKSIQIHIIQLFHNIF